MDPERDKFEGKSIPMTVITPVTPWKRFLVPLIFWVIRFYQLRDVPPLRFIHFARWAIIRPHAFAQATEADSVNRTYFLFSTNYNGPFDQYIDAFCAVWIIRTGIDVIWWASARFPHAWPISPFKRYIHYHEYPVDAYYNAYPGASVRDIEAALTLRVALSELHCPPPRDVLELDVRLDALIAKRANVPRHGRRVAATDAHTHLAVLTPIDYTMPGADDAKLAALREQISADRWREVSDGIFAQCGMVHMARFQIIDRLISGMGESSPDRTRWKYLLFIAELDGTSDDFYDHLYRFNPKGAFADRHDPRFVEQIWGNCRDFPTTQGPVFFRRYMRRFEIEPTLAYQGTDASLRDTLEALLVKSLWSAFRREHFAPDLSIPEIWGMWSNVVGLVPRLTLRALRQLSAPSNNVGAAHDQNEFGDVSKMIERLMTDDTHALPRLRRYRYG